MDPPGGYSVPSKSTSVIVPSEPPTTHTHSPDAREYLQKLSVIRPLRIAWSPPGRI
jgi:hypothetical protein